MRTMSCIVSLRAKEEGQCATLILCQKALRFGLLQSNCTPITIKKWSQIFISTTRNWIFNHIAYFMPYNGKQWPFMVCTLWKWFKILKNIKFCYCGSGEAFQFVTLINQTTTKNSTVGISPLQKFWHICITCAGYTANCLPKSFNLSW